MTKELYFGDTLVSIIYNIALDTQPIKFVCKYAALNESLVTNIALCFASCYICQYGNTGIL